ncbi:MAG TPA: YggT family protein [Usitatibacter sp.]|nr:YggT family protein [Usitatibacter sp.]
MIANALAIVINSVFALFIMAVLVRFWMQVVSAPTRNPFAQFSIALTDFAVRPLRRVVPGFFRLDLASILVALAFEMVLQVLLVLLRGANPFENALAVLPILLFYSFVQLIRLSIYIFMVSILIQAVISWVSPHHPVAPFFDAFTRPLLRPVRKVIPLIGGVDISPLFAFLFLQLLLMIPVALLEQESLRMLSRALL